MVARVYSIQGGKGKHGPINRGRKEIICNACGNKGIFHGKAIVNPDILIKHVGEGQYDVTQISYKSDGSVDEVPERCALCNSYDLTINNLD